MDLQKNEITYLQFVLPCNFRKLTVISCHDQFGHLGMFRNVRVRVQLSWRILKFSMNKSIDREVVTDSHDIVIALDSLMANTKQTAHKANNGQGSPSGFPNHGKPGDRPLDI